MEKKKRRYFPDEFKRQAVERVETSGLSIMDVAAEPGVHETQLRRWIRQFCKSGTGRGAPIRMRRARPRPTWRRRMMSHRRAIGPGELPVVAPSVRATTGDGEC
jgi:transposase